MKALIRFFGLKGSWLWAVRQQKMTNQMKIDAHSILAVPMICPKCDWKGVVAQAEPDVDGEGSLGCPECQTVLKMKGEGNDNTAGKGS